MINVQKFVFSGFQENTYLLIDETTRKAIIIDPGCYSSIEKQEFSDFIVNNEIQPERLVNTHYHLDHIFGNKFVSEKWNLKVEGSEEDLPTLRMAPQAASMYGFNGFEDSPEPEIFHYEGDVITLGDSELEVVSVPGHSVGHIAFICHEQKFVIGGDVLFHRSIGRYDLPGGDFDTLKDSILNKFYTLPDDYLVYSGHGSETVIGEEKMHNPFVSIR